MSVHPSLSSKGKGKRIRSVLKRFERLRELEEKEKRKTGDSIFGLPKIKALRWKVKKAKKATEEEQVASEQTTKAKAEKSSSKKEEIAKK
jgi:small basic protein (TIGR04137 family)